MNRIIVACIASLAFCPAQAALYQYIFEGDLLRQGSNDFFSLDGAHARYVITIDTNALAFEKTFIVDGVFLRYAPIQERWEFSNRPGGAPDVTTIAKPTRLTNQASLMIRDYFDDVVLGARAEEFRIQGGELEADDLAPITGAPDPTGFAAFWTYYFQKFSPTRENMLPTSYWITGANSGPTEMSGVQAIDGSAVGVNYYLCQCRP